MTKHVMDGSVKTAMKMAESMVFNKPVLAMNWELKRFGYAYRVHFYITSLIVISIIGNTIGFFLREITLGRIILISISTIVSIGSLIVMTNLTRYWKNRYNEELVKSVMEQ